MDLRKLRLEIGRSIHIRHNAREAWRAAKDIAAWLAESWRRRSDDRALRSGRMSAWDYSKNTPVKRDQGTGEEGGPPCARR